MFRGVLVAAGTYNLAFGAWAALRPQDFFAWTGLAPLSHPQVWQCLGMVVGVYGLLYLHAARHLERARPIVAVGLLGKVLGPLGWAKAVAFDDWPLATIGLVVVNDLVWWFPFGLFLWRTRPGAARIAP